METAKTVHEFCNSQGKVTKTKTAGTGELKSLERGRCHFFWAGVQRGITTSSQTSECEFSKIKNEQMKNKNKHTHTRESEAKQTF